MATKLVAPLTPRAFTQSLRRQQRTGFFVTSSREMRGPRSVVGVSQGLILHVNQAFRREQYALALPVTVAVVSLVGSGETNAS